MIKIVQGEDKEIIVKITNEDEDAYSLALVTEVTACLKNADGTSLEVTMTGGAISIVDSQPVNGKLKIDLTDAQTALLKKGSKSDMEIAIDESAKKTILQFPGEVEVLARLC